MVDCDSCLSNNCVFCPLYFNPSLTYLCQETQNSNLCARPRITYCEDSLLQIQSNFTASIKNLIMRNIENGPNPTGIHLNITAISNPLSNGKNQLQLAVYFTSIDSSWNPSEQNTV